MTRLNKEVIIALQQEAICKTIKAFVLMIQVK